MEQILFWFNNVNWFNASIAVGVNVFYFVFYIVLIYTTAIAVIKGFGNILYDTDVKDTYTSIMASAVIWALYLVIHMS